MSSRALRAATLLWFALTSLPALGAGPAGQEGLPGIAVAELPGEARETLRTIKRGGPFPYPRDGAVFRNYERVLPERPRGYYHEYTVKTPGVRNRGVRRIVCGVSLDCYYSADHYRTFNRIREQP